MSRVTPLILLILSACASTPLKAPNENASSGAHGPRVTIETSGDLYPTQNERHYQMDFFGTCISEKRNIIIRSQGKKRVVNCQNGQYKYSHFFDKKTLDENKVPFVLLKVGARHKDADLMKASSWIVFQKDKTQVKTVLNRQIHYEKIPTGELEPVTEFNAFGPCSDGARVNMDIVGKDHFGQSGSKYKDNKTCKNGSFYFLSKIDGVTLEGMEFRIAESNVRAPIKSGDRSLASPDGSPDTVEITEGFSYEFSIPMD